MNIQYKLYYYPLCPLSRKVRIFLNEKNIKADMAIEEYWQKRENFLKLNPTGEIPVLLAYENNDVICGSRNICEFIEETHKGVNLIGDNPAIKAEARRICDWFDIKFHQEVTNYVLSEKIIKFYSKSGSPNPHYLRAAKLNIEYHFDYMEFLLKKRKWLASNKITIADFAAASELSVLDYLGHVEWEKRPIIKEWYVLVKSRPSFAPLLKDKITGFTPAKHYDNLDF